MQNSQLSKLDRLKLNPKKFWDNLSLRNKLLLLLTTTTVLPILAVTQQLVNVSENSFIDKLKGSLTNKAAVLRDQYVVNAEIPEEAEKIAEAIEESELDLNLVQTDKEIQKWLQILVKLDSESEIQKHLSFKIVTDAKGRTISQDILVLKDNNSAPKLPSAEEEVPIQEYQSVELPTGIPLNDIPIVQEVLITGKALSGVELVKGAPLERLGLGAQAEIATRPQIKQGLPVEKQPVPKGTYDIDNNKAGLVNMAVYPIEGKDGEIVGTVIVGSLINRNYQLIDEFQQKYNSKGVATIFAQDWRVSTNVPYASPATKKTDGTRSIGTFLAREVAEVVLNDSREFVGKTNVVGSDYFTSYLPIYDHNKQLNSQAKPIGIAFIGQPLESVNNEIRSQSLSNYFLGYGLGGGILIIVLLIAIPLSATISNPLSNLAKQAKNLQEGNAEAKIPTTERSDEIGLLNNALSSLVETLVANQEQLRQEFDRREQQAIIIQNESENLTLDIGQLLDVVSTLEQGDFTVKAEVSDRATGLVADTLNRLIEELANTLSNVVSTVQQVTVSADDLEKLALNTSKQVQEQTQSVTNIKNLVASVNSISQNTAEQALISSDAVKQAREAVDRGEEEILAMSEEIELLQDGTQQIIKRAETLGDFVSLAAQFAEDQKRVAALTRVLALNASMVASRASAQEDPEQFIVITKEFETIAQQVNDLAVQTNQGLLRLKQRTDQIETVVSGITQDIQDIDRAVSQFDLSVQNSRQVFNNIKEVTIKVDRVGQEVTSSSMSIAELTQTTLVSVEDIAKVATEAERSSQFTSEQASLMEHLARTLVERVSFFRLKQKAEDADKSLVVK
jgi:methyl-accepting chemotaxis protein